MSRNREIADITQKDLTKEGVLTFTSSPIVPTPTNGDSTTKVATTAFVLANTMTSSAWVNKTGTRAIGTTYTNTSNKPIMVAVKYTSGGSGNYVNLTTQVVVISQATSYTSGITIIASGVIASGQQYVVNASGGALQAWYEFI